MKLKGLFAKAVGLFLVLSVGAFAAETPALEDELQQLAVPTNEMPPAANSEMLYSVQTRLSPLAHRHEITIGGAKNFTSDSFLSSYQIDLGYRFYLSDRWYLGASGSYVFNSFTDAANRLIKAEKLVPDVAYPKFRGDLLVGFNLFYGKFRLSMDKVFYFDQYIALGPGVVSLNTGMQWAAVADIGLVLWMGQASIRFGLKDYFFKENRAMSSGMVHNLLAHLDLGIVLGR
jgi:outer membrane beta-barrel protein